jgi:hypothetical protein
VRAYVSLAHALLYRRDRTPLLHPVADQLRQFLDTPLAPATQRASATLLIAYHRLKGHAYRAAHKKPPHRLLELLKALVAFGSDGVEQAELADTLWPQAEGDRARNALIVNLSRLRTLLGRDDTVLLHDGRVVLNRHCCWIDA